MKLLDILASEMKDWPSTRTGAVGQSESGSLHLNQDARHGSDFFGWTTFKFKMAEDWKTAWVTRSEWQAAVDALKAPKVVDWDEFGFPPAGVSCEFTSNDGYNWKPCRILYADELSILTGELEGKADRRLLRKCDADVKFRPARTAEQVAAEEREAEDNEVMSRYMSLSDCEKGILGHSPERVIIGLMRVMGYRKEPKPCGS